jgi:hypothetical protein
LNCGITGTVIIGGSNGAILEALKKRMKNAKAILAVSADMRKLHDFRCLHFGCLRD